MAQGFVNWSWKLDGTHLPVMTTSAITLSVPSYPYLTNLLVFKTRKHSSRMCTPLLRWSSLDASTWGYAWCTHPFCVPTTWQCKKFEYFLTASCIHFQAKPSFYRSPPPPKILGKMQRVTNKTIFDLIFLLILLLHRMIEEITMWKNVFCRFHNSRFQSYSQKTQNVCTFET